MATKAYGDNKWRACVKWFSRKNGWGFVTLTEAGDYCGDDIFVHWRSLVANEDSYKYLSGGEYVTVTITPTEDGRYEAATVTGIDGGALMCDYVDKKAHAHRGRKRPESVDVEMGAVE